MLASAAVFGAAWRCAVRAIVLRKEDKADESGGSRRRSRFGHAVYPLTDAE